MSISTKQSVFYWLYHSNIYKLLEFQSSSYCYRYRNIREYLFNYSNFLIKGANTRPNSLIKSKT